MCSSDLRWMMRTKFVDAQCGFKAMRRDIAQQLLPHVKDTAWFFDTELLVKAEYEGYTIHEEPMKWIEDTDSRVHIVKTATKDIKGLSRVRGEYGRATLFEAAGFGGLLLVAACAAVGVGKLLSCHTPRSTSTRVGLRSTPSTAYLASPDPSEPNATVAELVQLPGRGNARGVTPVKGSSGTTVALYPSPKATPTGLMRKLFVAAVPMLLRVMSLKDIYAAAQCFFE